MACICQIISFDEGGVSGHPNHIAVFKGMYSVFITAPPSIEFLKLDSTGPCRKYSGVADILISILCTGAFIAINLNILKSYVAMSKHRSQFVWYRKLFVLFSRYSYVNTFRKL